VGTPLAECRVKGDLTMTRHSRSNIALIGVLLMTFEAFLSVMASAEEASPIEKGEYEAFHIPGFPIPGFPRRQCDGLVCVDDTVGVRQGYGAGVGRVRSLEFDHSAWIESPDGRVYRYGYQDIASSRARTGGVATGALVGVRLGYGSGAPAGYGRVIGVFPNQDVLVQGFEGPYRVFVRGDVADPTGCVMSFCSGSQVTLRYGGVGILVGVLLDQSVIVRSGDGRFFNFAAYDLVAGGGGYLPRPGHGRGRDHGRGHGPGHGGWHRD